MNKTFSNPCSRCGRERVVVRTWKEKVYDSVIVNTEKECPNPDCQKLVNRENNKQKEKYRAIRRKTEERARNRKSTNEAKKALKNKKKK